LVLVFDNVETHVDERFVVLGDQRNAALVEARVGSQSKAGRPCSSQMIASILSWSACLTALFFSMASRFWAKEVFVVFILVVFTERFFWCFANFKNVGKFDFFDKKKISEYEKRPLSVI
jgi:hypothetical protein